jgi:Na+/alanine symporter
MVFIGAISEVKTIWSIVDIILACMAVPHMAALLLYAHKKKSSDALSDIL